VISGKLIGGPSILQRLKKVVFMRLLFLIKGKEYLMRKI
jgi:hypothetical protein